MNYRISTFFSKFELMKNLVAIFVSAFVGLLFLSNIGILFNKHFCKKDGVSISYFHKEDHECKHFDKKPKCCQTIENEVDCCHDEMIYHQVKLDFSNTVFQFEFIEPFIFESTPIWAELYEDDRYSVTFSEYPNPPPKNGRILLLEKQVLRL